MVLGPLIIESPIHSIYTLSFKCQSAIHNVYSQEQRQKAEISSGPRHALSPREEYHRATGLSHVTGQRIYIAAMILQVLQPAIELAEEGFPVAPVTAYHWQAASMELRGPGKAAFLNPQGRAPGAGEIQKNPDLGRTFRSVAEHGALEGAAPH